MGSTESSTHDKAAATRSTTASVTELLELVDWTALPAETRQTIRTLGPLMQEGCSQSEIARRLGLTDSQVVAMRRQMGDAIIEQAAARAGQLDPKLRDLVDRLRAGRSSTARRAAGETI